MNIDTIKRIEEGIYKGSQITLDEARLMCKITQSEEIKELCDAANRIRLKMSSEKVDLCTIMNAKSGKCTEDCKFCAQSAHYNTNVEEYGLVNSHQVLDLAKENQECGANRFSLVTSGRGISENELEKVIDIYSELNTSIKMDLCASLGILSFDSLKKLTQSGITMYHHNLETSREFYPEVCTTHTYDQRIQTINAAKEAGMEICSGGIIGMGETWEDRISLAFQLKELEVNSIPVNVLNPILGTPFQMIPPLKQDDILKTIAIFRFINPSAYIRLAGGRNMIEDFGKKCFTAGANASITGNYLTTSGNKIVEDIAMIESLGQEVRKND